MGDNQTTSPPLGNTAGLLPSPADVSSAATQIPVSSADVQPLTTVKLDELGPLVVNEDG